MNQQDTPVWAALEADPGRVIEFECVLPSGLVGVGTIGPLIGQNCAVNFHIDGKPTPEDVTFMREVMDRVMGFPPEQTHFSTSVQEARETIRRFYGGGMG